MPGVVGARQRRRLQRPRRRAAHADRGGVRVAWIAVDQQDREAPVGPAHRVRADGGARRDARREQAVQRVAGLRPRPRQQPGRPQRGGRVLDAPVRPREPQRQVAPRVAVRQLADERVGLGSVHVRGVAAVRQQGADRVGVEHGAGQVDLGACGERRVAELGDLERHARGDTLGALAAQRRGEHRGRARELRADGRAPVVERVPLEREEVEPAQRPAPAQLAHEAPRPRALAVRVGPGDPVRDRGLQAGPAERDARVGPRQRAGELGVQRPVVLGRGELAVRLLAELDAAQRDPMRAQPAQLGDRVGRRAVEHRDRRQHPTAAGEPGRQHGREARLVVVGVAVAGRVPGVGRGGKRHGLPRAARGVADEVVEPPAAQRSDAELADGVAEPVAHVARPAWRGVRRACQKHAHEAHGLRAVRDAQRLHAPARGEPRARKPAPAPGRMAGERDRARPVEALDLKARRVRRPPTDAHGVDAPRPAEVDEHPLRARHVGEVRIEVRVALPEGSRPPVVEARVPVVLGLVDGVAAAREPVAVGDADRPAGAPRRRPVAAMVPGVAPVPGAVPVPRLDAELGAQAVARRPQPGRGHRADVRARVDAPRVAALVAVECHPEGAVWAERVHDPGRVDGHDERGGRRDAEHELPQPWPRALNVA